jgi:hypothetical protein
VKYTLKKNGDPVETFNSIKKVTTEVDRLVDRICADYNLDWQVGWEWVTKDKDHFWVEAQGVKVNKYGRR